MSLKNRNGGLIGLALLCTSAFMTTAAAAPALIVRSRDVSYVAAELTRAEDAQKLYMRIQHAARIVCEGPDVRDLSARNAYQECYARAVNDAVAKVDAPTLTALHQSKVSTQRYRFSQR